MLRHIGLKMVKTIGITLVKKIYEKVSIKAAQNCTFFRILALLYVKENFQLKNDIALWGKMIKMYDPEMANYEPFFPSATSKNLMNICNYINSKLKYFCQFCPSVCERDDYYLVILRYEPKA